MEQNTYYQPSALYFVVLFCPRSVFS